MCVVFSWDENSISLDMNPSLMHALQGRKPTEAWHLGPSRDSHDIWNTLLWRYAGLATAGATHENHTLMSQRVHLLPNGLEVEGISCEIWCHDNMLFVPWDTSCSHSFKQSSRPATYSSWPTNQSLGIPSVRWHMWRWRICIFAKKTKTKHWTVGKIQQNGDF